MSGSGGCSAEGAARARCTGATTAGMSAVAATVAVFWHAGNALRRLLSPCDLLAGRWRRLRSASRSRTNPPCPSRRSCSASLLHARQREWQRCCRPCAAAAVPSACCRRKRASEPGAPRTHCCHPCFVPQGAFCQWGTAGRKAQAAAHLLQLPPPGRRGAGAHDVCRQGAAAGRGGQAHRKRAEQPAVRCASSSRQP